MASMKRSHDHLIGQMVAGMNEYLIIFVELELRPNIGHYPLNLCRVRSDPVDFVMAKKNIAPLIYI